MLWSSMNAVGDAECYVVISSHADSPLPTSTPSHRPYVSEKAKTMYNQQSQLFCSVYHSFYRAFLPCLIFFYLRGRGEGCVSSSLFRWDPNLYLGRIYSFLTWNLSPNNLFYVLKFSFSTAFFIFVYKCLWLSLHVSNLTCLKLQVFFSQNQPILPGGKRSPKQLRSSFGALLTHLPSLHIPCIQPFFSIITVKNPV